MANSQPTRRTPLEPWQDANARPFLQIQKVTKTFGATYAVDDVSLDVYQGEFFSLLGGSGCGKTTLLRILAGFEKPDAGRVLIDGVDVTDLPPYARPVNMMFQSYALFPHLSVEQNIAFGLHQERMPRKAIAERVAEMLELVQLSNLRKRRPDQLSGGQRQRVALARALAKHPKLLLLDEPLGALDKKLRERTQFELMSIQERVGITFVTVTHDQEEALTMSTRVAVMDAGRIVQVNTPANLYEFPANRFVAGFIGSVNLIEGRVVEQLDGEVRIQAEGFEGSFVMDHVDPLPLGTPVAIAVRPEKLNVHDEKPTDRPNWVHGRVVDIAYLGDVSIYHLETAGGRSIRVQITHEQRYSRPHYRWEDEIYVSWDSEDGVLLLA
jgi:putrescine transport system ATP-binding protein